MGWTIAKENGFGALDFVVANVRKGWFNQDLRNSHYSSLITHYLVFLLQTEEQTGSYHFRPIVLPTLRLAPADDAASFERSPL